MALQLVERHGTAGPELLDMDVFGNYVARYSH
jgi:hypothetical protein